MFVNRLAWIALISVIFLVLAGATVRVTGSGLGCPDWPTCWGCVIPPTNIDQIDVEKLDLEKFKRHAARKGIDPDTITRETVLDSFDPVHTWIEFSNRLASLPLGFATLLLALFSFGARRNKGWIIGLSWFCLADVIFNAVMGAIVVRSGLQPGIITLHMALALLLVAVLVTIIWLSRKEPYQQELSSGKRFQLQLVSLLFFFCLFGEGIMGSQLREQTDELAIQSEREDGLERDKWGEELGATLIYKIHRSFSWTLLIAALALFVMAAKVKDWQAPEPKWILAMVLGMMVMGIVLGHIQIHPVVQVLHVATTAVLLAVTWHWVARLWSTKAVQP